MSSRDHSARISTQPRELARPSTRRCRPKCGGRRIDGRSCACRGDLGSAVTAAQSAPQAQLYQDGHRSAARFRISWRLLLGASPVRMRPPRRPTPSGRIGLTDMPDFASLPPEINAGLMYSRARFGPMLTAASAWADCLQSCAPWRRYEAVIAALTDGSWLGPAAASMAASSQAQVEWLTSTAGRPSRSPLRRRPRSAPTSRRSSRRCRHRRSRPTARC